MSNVLERIVEAKRARLARGEYAPGATPDRPSDGASFLASLKEPGARIVAEFKARSPSAGQIVGGADGKLESFALAYRRGHAAAISVVTEQDHFGGRPDWIPRAKRMSGLPVLMKDFILSEIQLDFAVSLGADAVLLIARILADADLAELRRGARRRNLCAVVEAHDEEDVARAAAVEPDVLGVNARDLESFETNLDAVAALARRMPEGPVRMAESGIFTRADVARLAAAGFQAFLVGEALLKSDDPEEELRSLRS